MGNDINIGNGNKIKESNIVGGDNHISKSNDKKPFWAWVLKHIETIVASIISGATSALVAWLITYLCLQ